MQLPKLIKKKECYRLSWFSILIILFIFSSLFLYIRNNLYNYLSPIKPISSKTLVVEGWLEDYALEEAYKLFIENGYERIITTGGPLNQGYLVTKYKTTADIAKATFLELGMDSTKIFVAPSELFLQERTYQSALSLRNYIKQEDLEIENFNLVSLGLHSKRSYELFKKAFPEKKIGIIAIRDQRFNHEKWWSSSKGLRTVITEAIGYIFVALFG